MGNFIETLEHLQQTIYWNGVLVSLFEISFLIAVFFTILFYVFKKKLTDEDGRNFLIRIILVSFSSLLFLIIFSIILSHNLEKEQIIEKVAKNDRIDTRFVEKLDGSFIKVNFVNGKIDESSLEDGFTYKINKYSEYYEVPINYDDYGDVSKTLDNDISIERAFIEDVDTIDSKIYLTLVNHGDVDISDISIQLRYEGKNFDTLKETFEASDIKACSSKVVSFKFNTSKINKVDGALLYAVIIYDKDPDISNNKMKVSYFR